MTWCRRTDGMRAKYYAKRPPSKVRDSEQPGVNIMDAPSSISTYQHLFQLVYAVSRDDSSPLSGSSANKITAAFRALVCSHPQEAEVRLRRLSVLILLLILPDYRCSWI